MDKKKRVLLVAGLFIVLCVSIVTTAMDSPLTKKNEHNENITAIEAASPYPLMEKDWSVNYKVKKQKIYIENIIPRFSFQGNTANFPNQLDGYIAVFMNGKWKLNANQSIFILKDVSPGKHLITLHLKKKDGSDYGMKKNIYVQVK
ncbi:hypothetical protein KUV80_06115 [Fictibacillus nanhaiensis]|uniref:hypothetical protein n=1 Tax=Fictibacillus nanhaiensis TaxID=742169 RepID=UPI001C98A3BE|nr:hypothetical protein [Fictibacillus nanhaiensis]MBY6036217.1 hypothetical protein [Fictibacillus nanhaiensis]